MNSAAATRFCAPLGEVDDDASQNHVMTVMPQACVAGTLTVVRLANGVEAVFPVGQSRTFELVSGTGPAPGTGLRCTIATGASRCTAVGTITNFVAGAFASIGVTGPGNSFNDAFVVGWVCK